MEYDPVNKEVNPSRYQLESDSEEDDQLPQQKNLDDQSPRHLERIKLELPVKSEGVDLSILLNQAGLSWSQSSALRNQPEHGRLLVDGIQQASISIAGDPSQPISMLFCPTFSVLSFNEIQGPLVQALLQELKPKSVTLFASYSPHLYIQSHSEKAQTYEESDSDFPPLRYLLSGTGCKNLKTKILSSKVQDLKPYQSPNVLTGLGGVIASQSTYLSLPLMVLLFPESVSQPHSHHHSHAFLPSSSQDSTSRPLFSSSKVEDRLAKAAESILKIGGKATKSSDTGIDQKTIKRLDGFLFEKRGGEEIGTNLEEGQGDGENFRRKETNDSMYL